MTDKDKPATTGQAKDQPKARVILPKVQKHEGGYHPAGPGGERLTGRQAKAQDRKPPKSPGRAS